MSKEKHPNPYIHFDAMLCTGCSNSLRACPTQSIRIKKGKPVHLEGLCIGCGECIRVCPTGAVRAATSELESLDKNQISVALVSPVLYSQFPGVMPDIVLQGLRQMGFRHAVDMSYFLEMFQCATEEYIARNRVSLESPWPLISPVCPVVVRLIAFRFPSLLPNVVPVIRPVALMAREVKNKIVREYGVKKDAVAFYYINPCPSKRYSEEPSFSHEQPYVDRTLGINDVYAKLSRELEQIRKGSKTDFPKDIFDYSVTGTSLIWGISGGDITGINTDRTLAISGLQETVAYLEKIELGMFQDVEYIEFRTCPEGCLGGTLTAIDKYLAKSAAQKMVLESGLKRRISQDKIVRLYDAGWFQTKSSLGKLACAFGAQKKPLSIEELQEIDSLLELIQGMDCSACGAPNCRAFAEDVVRGKASLADCLVFQARKK